MGPTTLICTIPFPGCVFLRVNLNEPALCE